MSNQWWRVGGYLGVAFVVTFIVAIVVQLTVAGEPPSYSDPVAEIRAYWEDEGTAYLATDYLFGLAYIVLFIPFLACLTALLGRAEGGGQVFSRTALIAGTLAVAISAAAAASWLALAFAAENLSDDAIVTLMYLDVGAWNNPPFPFGLFLLSASYVIFSTGVLRKWLGVLGMVIGLAALISPLSIVDDPEGPLGFLGFISFLGLAVWLLIAAVSMIMLKEEPVARTPSSSQ